MHKSLSKIQEIIDLNPDGTIANSISERQLKVIYKAYNYLIKSDNNNIVYIADEVGLGKTYIAMGIMALLRHEDQESNDLIIVPKSNLQKKWDEAIKSFFDINYLWPIEPKFKEDDFYKPKIYDKINQIDKNSAFQIFRMTAFSNIAFTEDNETERKKLLCRLLKEDFKDDDFSKKIIIKAYSKKYFLKKNFKMLRHLLAYLYNIRSPKISCLIIDEAHNYKYGPGNDQWDSSIRNDVTARFLGAYKDAEIFNDFPELLKKVKFPLAKKVICLSATPKDISLLEVKNQLNCFTTTHILSSAETDSEIQKLLPKFLIRGNMEYQFGDLSFSRNQSREEHRLGNVNKAEIPEKLEIKDDFEGIFWQLMQYQSLKHLQLKNGASFEMGMLAGFESYTLDMDKRVQNLKNKQNSENDESGIANKEYEETKTRNKKESEDINVVRGIIESYHKNFNSSLPPHPKQSKFEAEILDQLKRQEKSLTFVRRVMTVNDLEKRLLHLYEKEIVIEKQLNLKLPFYKNFELPKITKMVKDWNQREMTSRLPETIDSILSTPKWKKELKHKSDNEIEIIKNLLFALYHSEEGSFKTKFQVYFNKNTKKSFNELVIYSLENLNSTNVTAGSEVDEDIENQLDSNEFDGFFFNNYFSYGIGKKFKAKIYRENWFEIDLGYVFNQYKIFKFNNEKLIENLNSINESTDNSRKNQSYAIRQKCISEFLNENAIIDNGDNISESNFIPLQETEGSQIHSDNTFLTDLLLTSCENEFKLWIDSTLITDTNPKDFLIQLNYLQIILRNIFRNGTGLLPAFVADSNEKNKSFKENMKILITDKASPFYFVLEEVKTVLKDFKLQMNTNFRGKTETEINTMFRSLSPVLAISGQIKRDRSLVAAQFRMAGFPYVLISTDILREGEDLHTYCQNVYHYGIAWNPSDMEQRTGRIDRINSLSYRKLTNNKKLDFNNKIQVFYPYLSQSIEVNQVSKLLWNMNHFTRTFNDVANKNTFESNVNIDEDIDFDSLPKAIHSKIQAIYDVDNFEGDLESEE